MKFQIEVPDEVFWRAAARAEMFGQKVNEFTADLIIAASTQPLDKDNDPVVRLWRAGLSDSDIGRQLNRTNLSVATRRRMYKLPANRKNGFQP